MDYNASNNNIVKNYFINNLGSGEQDPNLTIWDKFFDIGDPNRQVQQLKVNYNIPTDKKSIALNVTIQSMNKTLKDQDLEKASKLIGANNPLRRAGTPEDIANAVLYLASDEASFTNGAVLVVDAAGESIADRNSRFVDMGSQTVQEADRSGI